MSTPADYHVQLKFERLIALLVKFHSIQTPPPPSFPEAFSSTLQETALERRADFSGVFYTKRYNSSCFFTREEGMKYNRSSL